MILGSPISKLKTRMAIRLSSFVFLLQNAGRKRQKEENDGLLLVMVETPSSVRKTATYVACILSAKMGQLMKQPIPYQLQQARKRLVKCIYAFYRNASHVSESKVITIYVRRLKGFVVNAKHVDSGWTALYQQKRLQSLGKCIRARIITYKLLRTKTREDR